MKILCKSCNTYDADFENLLLIFFYAVVISNVVCLFFKDLRVYNSVFIFVVHIFTYQRMQRFFYF